MYFYIFKLVLVLCYKQDIKTTNLYKTFETAHMNISGPVADDECRHRQADDEVDVHDESQTWLLFQSAHGRLGRRRRIVLPLLLHPTQPAEDGHEPGLSPDAGNRRVWRT